MLFLIDFLEERECVERLGWIKYCKNHEKLHQEHIIGCQGVKLFLLWYVIITTVPTATVIIVTITTVTIWFFWVWSHFNFLSFVNISVFEFCHILSFWDLSQFDFNRPGVAGAVLQSPLSLINWFIEWSFRSWSSRHCQSQIVRAGEVKF